MSAGEEVAGFVYTLFCVSFTISEDVWTHSIWKLTRKGAFVVGALCLHIMRYVFALTEMNP